MEVVEDYPEQFIWPIQRTLGDAAFDAGQLEKSRDLHTKAYELALNKKSGDEADSIYYLSEGRVLHRLGKTDQARENLIRALDLSQPKNEPVEIINALYNLAHLHTDEGLFLEAERLIAAAKDAAAELKDSRLTAAVAQTDGWLAWSQNDLTTAEVEFQRCLDLLNSIDDQAARPMAMVYLALVWGARGDEKARELLTEAGETFLRWDHSGGIAFTHLAWGFFYTSAGDDSAAAKALITALESALGGDEIYFAVQILVALGINLADQGDHALALSTLAYAAAHPALTHHDQALVQTQIEILQDKLTPPEYAAARDQWLEASIDIVFSRIQMGFAT
jgi:tetratricopeptide (TPR) repeat protein